MQPLGDMRVHLRLVARMAQATDTDLVAAYRDGLLDQESWADMVRTCRACAWAGRCPEWLAAHADSAKAPQPCGNGARFAALASALGGERRANV